MAYNVGDLFELAVDAVPDRVAVLCGDEQLTYAELDARANRLAHHLIARGIEPGDHVGIYGYNSLPWVEALLAVTKARAVPVNVNYRYVEDELHYLFDNADLKGLVYDETFGPRVAAVIDSLPLLHALVMIEDGSGAAQPDLDVVPLEKALADSSPERDFPPRSPDDQVIIYTGGTTGMPKGVMWRGEDLFFALMGGIDAFTQERVTSDHQHADRARESLGQLHFLIVPPLMHGAAFVATLMNLFQGQRIIILPKFEAEEVWRTIAEHGIHSLLIVGDAMGRPLIETLERLDAEGVELDLSSFLSLSSSAAVFSPTVKDRFLERFPNLILTDSIGSTESGMNGITTVQKDHTAMSAGGPTVTAMRDSVVLDDELNVVAPGSGIIGKVARTGNIPLGYYKDPVKTAQTWVTGTDGVRYAMPGDYATLEADGTLTLLGRGSVSINSGGEKIFPEEVEHALKAHPDVFDAVVVGVPDERWGQRVAAVIEPRPGTTPELPSLQEHCRQHIAGYKVPRELHLVEAVVRSPSGKADYPWAKRLAESGANKV